MPARTERSVLDRLRAADAEPSSSATDDGPEALRADVLGDLEALLNTRRRHRPLPAALTELRGSILDYGILDPAAGAYSAREAQQVLADEVRDSIERHEPRLRRLDVQVQADDSTDQRTLQLHIEATLLARAGAEPVSIHSTLEPVTRQVDVRAQD